jgi:hypothetical protein
LASLIPLTCFVAGVAALLELEADWAWLISSPGGLLALSVQLGFGVGTALLVYAAWACNRNRWRRAGVSFAIGIGLVITLFFCMGAIAQR